MCINNEKYTKLYKKMIAIVLISFLFHSIAIDLQKKEDLNRKYRL